MNPGVSNSESGFGSYRIKLMGVMMLMVSAVTGAGLFLAERNLAESVTKGFDREFVAEIETVHSIQELRKDNYSEVCLKLVRKPRIHAALEDNALDLLYPIAKDELRDLIIPPSTPSRSKFAAEFYRFLDSKGRVITPYAGADAGNLRPEEEAQLSLPELPQINQTGYILRSIESGSPALSEAASSSFTELSEVIVTPIISTETSSPIAALAIGFKPLELSHLGNRGIRSGIWVQPRLHMAGITPGAQEALNRLLNETLGKPGLDTVSSEVSIDGTSYLIFHKELNPGSIFPPAREILFYPLVELVSRKRQLRWNFAGGGGIVLLGGFLASKILSTRFSTPVELLATESEDKKIQHARTQALLELTHEGLQRAVRFSADASHQLKTPVTVMRTGLEEVLSRNTLAPEVREELGHLVHQTYRIASVVEDLLLLSQVDAGRLPIKKQTVDLSRLLDTALDDLDIANASHDLSIEAEIPTNIAVEGEARYINIILQNLIENARKYNRPGGRIRIMARSEDARVRVSIGNTGVSIPAEVQSHIFERFHRGSMGENVPGHGLGLNLARELARVNGGELRLMRSDSDWTEFEASFKRVIAPISMEVSA